MGRDILQKLGITLQQRHLRSRDQATLRQPPLSRELIWDWDNDSEPELDIQYKAQSQPARSSDSDDSENAPLLSHTRVPGKIIPDRLELTFGDKTSTVIYNKKNVARRTIARKAPETPGTLKPQWNIIPDGTITKYTPHKVTLDTNTRKNRVIRKNDLAIVTETKPIETAQIPRLIHMVACKTVGEYKRNQEKIKKFFLEEKANKAREEEQRAKLRRKKIPLQPKVTEQRPIVNRDEFNHQQVVELARRNQQEQRKPKAPRQAKQPPQTKPPARRTSLGTSKQPKWLKEAKSRINKKKPLIDFNSKSKEETLKHAIESRSNKPEDPRKFKYSSSSDNRSITSMNTSKLKFSPSVKVSSIPSDSPGTTFEIVASSSATNFMNDETTTPSKGADPPEQSCSYTANVTSSIPKGIMKSTPKVGKIVSNIWKRQQANTEQSPDKDITVVTIEDTSPENSPGKVTQRPQVINLESTDKPHEQAQANDVIQDPEDIGKQSNIHNAEEEHTQATTSPAKSSISDLHASDFYNPSEF